MLIFRAREKTCAKGEDRMLPDILQNSELLLRPQSHPDHLLSSDQFEKFDM